MTARDAEQLDPAGPGGPVARLRPLFAPRGIAGLTTAVRALAEDARAQLVPRRPGRRPASIPLVTPASPVDEEQAKTLLAALGVPTPPRRACRDHGEAHRALAELPGPVAVKILDAEVSHKSDIGGVHLGVRDRVELDAALDALDRIGARRYRLETMAPPGIDLIAGASRDPVGNLLVANPALEAVEINPLRVTSQGLLALNAVVTLTEPAAPKETDHA